MPVVVDVDAVGLEDGPTTVSPLPLTTKTCAPPDEHALFAFAFTHPVVASIKLKAEFEVRWADILSAVPAKLASPEKSPAVRTVDPAPVVPTSRPSSVIVCPPAVTTSPPAVIVWPLATTTSPPALTVSPPASM